MFGPTTKDDVLDLQANLGQPYDIFAPMRFLKDKGFGGFFASLFRNWTFFMIRTI